MRKLLIITLLAIVSVTTWAQDMGVWMEATSEFALNKKWDLSIDGEIRTREGMSMMERWGLGLSTDITPTKIWGFGFGYICLDTHKAQSVTSKGNIVDEYWRVKNRLFVQMKWKAKASLLRISLREKLQYTCAREVNIKKFTSEGVRKENETKEKEKGVVLRSKLNVSAKNKSLATPYVSYELNNDLKSSFALKKSRLDIGADLKLNKHNILTVSYKHNFYKDDDDDNTHNVLGIAYKFKL